eukprot:TRINITY_DN64100_c0_g1_i1.p1 TRINITY_DN64100_c0_g1~~TRINITY_DN64100_c0_g1_i1.p1  ORF type:complete len:147 (+),score=25.60 TRINITY_DN64100_c0_g1_i1:20-460(+)
MERFCRCQAAGLGMLRRNLTAAQGTRSRFWIQGSERGCASNAVAADSTQFGPISQEIERRDQALADARAAYEKSRGAGATLGLPMNRKLYVANLRSKDGRSRVPKLTITDSSGAKWMTLSEADFEAFVKFMPKIKEEIIKYNKKLS